MTDDARPSPTTRIPFVYRAHPEVFGRLLSVLAEEPSLLSRADEARRDLGGGIHPLQALSRHSGLAGRLSALLGEHAPAPVPGDAGGVGGLLGALRPYEHFLREVGTSLKAPLVRPKPGDAGLLSDLARLSATHGGLYRPAAKWLVTAGIFEEGGCRIATPPAFFFAPSMRRFFASPLCASEEEEYGEGGGDATSQHAPSTGPVRVVLYLVTAGPGWDEAAEEYARSGRPYLALLANALGAGAADTAAMDLNDYLDEEFFGTDETRRLRRRSPGYGDWPLSDQRVLMGALNPEDDLGVTLNEGDILVPEKSTSGIMAEKRRGQGGKVTWG